MVITNYWIVRSARKDLQRFLNSHYIGKKYTECGWSLANQAVKHSSYHSEFSLVVEVDLTDRIEKITVERI